MIRVLIADDQALVRQGLRALLERAGDMDIVGEARDGQEAIALVQELNPDVVTMDLVMPHLDGFAATLEIVALGAQARVIIVTSLSDESTVARALRSGARRMVTKSQVFDDLIPAIRSVCHDDEPAGQPNLRAKTRRSTRHRNSDSGAGIER